MTKDEKRILNVPNYNSIPDNAPGLKQRFTDLCILTVGLMNTINLDVATAPQRSAVQMLEAFLSRIPPEWR